MRIAGSPPGLRFDVVIALNTFVKQKKREERTIDEAIGEIRTSFWSAFNDALDADVSLRDCQRCYGGRLGFEWLLPKVGPQWQEDEPHVLAFITAGKGRGLERGDGGPGAMCGFPRTWAPSCHAAVRGRPAAAFTKSTQ